MKKKNYLKEYCEDLIIISPIAYHVNELLKVHDSYSKNWKMEFHASKLAALTFSKTKIVDNCLPTQMGSFILIYKLVINFFAMNMQMKKLKKLKKTCILFPH